MHDWIRYLYDRLQHLETEITQLKQQNEELGKKINQTTHPVHIDKIEYKIHELHVQTLSGTLNVGLTANGDDTCLGDVVEKIVEEHRSGNHIVIGEEENGD